MWNEKEELKVQQEREEADDRRCKESRYHPEPGFPMPSKSCTLCHARSREDRDCFHLF
jgi:hypothetical protein